MRSRLMRQRFRQQRCIIFELNRPIKTSHFQILSTMFASEHQFGSVTSSNKITDTAKRFFQWMPLEEFVKQPFIQEDHMFQKIMDICIQRLRKCYCGLTPHHVVSRFDDRTSTLYYNVAEPEDVNCSAT